MILKRRNIINILVFLPGMLILMNFYNCRKKCTCENSFKNIPETTKEWFWFGEGSWWIYRLAEDTTVFDTITLIQRNDESSNKFCESDFAPAKGCSEILTIFMQHTNCKYFPKTNFDTINAGYDLVHVYTPHGGGEFLSLERPGSEGVILGFPVMVGERYDQYTLQDTFSFVKIHDQIYYNVTHSVTKVMPPNISPDEVWWAKKIGLLKIIKLTGVKPKTTWELVKYQIK